MLFRSLILSKHFTNNNTKMPKLSKRQLQSRNNTLSLQKNLDYKGRFQKKRPLTVEVADADDAEDRTARQEWNLNIHELSGSESDEERDDVMFANIEDANIALDKLTIVVDKREIRWRATHSCSKRRGVGNSRSIV